MESNDHIQNLSANIDTLKAQLEKRSRKKRTLKTFFTPKFICPPTSELTVSFLSNLINSAVDGVVAADLQGKLLVYNQSAGTIFGYTEQEALDSVDVRDLFPDDGAAEIMARMRSEHFGGPGKLVGALAAVVDKQGVHIPVRINASIVYKNGKEVATIGYLRDLREKKDPKQELAGSVSTQGNDEPDVSLLDYLSGLTEQLHQYDQHFCIGAIRNDIVTRDQVKKALAKQFEIVHKTKIHIPVGRLMIQLGYITENQRNALVNLQRMESYQTRKEETCAPAGLEDLVHIEIAEDNLSATIEMEMEKHAGFTVQDILDFIETRGIVHGIVDATDIKNYLNRTPADAEPFVIATGDLVDPGTLPAVELFFNTDTLGVGTTREDGTIDWKNRGKLPLVRAGDILAQVTPGQSGSSGKDIFGKEILPPAIKSVPPKCGKGVGISGDGARYTAKIDGMVAMADNKISIVETMSIDGDVGLETGHIDFNGHVEVDGAVHKGYRISCNSLRVNDIHEAEITVAGNMVVLGGIYESRIKCKGTLQASQCRKSSIRTGGDFVVEKEIVESTVETSSMCVISGGTIIDSDIRAKNGIVAYHIGTQGSKFSSLFIGVDERAKRKLKYTRNKLEEQQKEMAILPGEIESLQQKYADLQEKTAGLGKSKRELSEAIDALESRVASLQGVENEAEVQRLRKKTDRLDREKAQVSEQLDRIEEKLSQLPARISRKKESLKGSEDNIIRLKEEIEYWAAEKLAVNEDVRVQVSGTLHAGTTITGPHALIKVADDVSDLFIQEKKRIDKEGAESWVMAIRSNTV